MQSFPKCLSYCIPTLQQYMSVPGAPHSHQHLLILTILVGNRSNVIFMCISLITRNQTVFNIFISHFDFLACKSPIKSFANFCIWSSIFLFITCRLFKMYSGYKPFVSYMCSRSLFSICDLCYNLFILSFENYKFFILI